MKVTIIPVTPFQQNCLIISCEETAKGAVVDPGGEVERIIAQAEADGVSIEKILVTHGHVDHAGGAAELAEQTGAPIEGPHEEDKFWLDSLPENSRNYGFSPLARSFTPNRWLNDGDRVSLGNEELEVLHCPGHTPGHVVFFHRKDKVALVGDVLFQGSIGRTDFPRGDYAALINSIHNQLWPLGDEVQFISGHGPMSSFGQERRTNPFVGDGA